MDEFFGEESMTLNKLIVIVSLAILAWVALIGIGWWIGGVLL